jgi:hypothetical protein
MYRSCLFVTITSLALPVQLTAVSIEQSLQESTWEYPSDLPTILNTSAERGFLLLVACDSAHYPGLVNWMAGVQALRPIDNLLVLSLDQEVHRGGHTPHTE